MKRAFFILLITGIVGLNLNTLNAQSKCKFLIDRTDPITGKTHKATNVFIKTFGLYSAVSSWNIVFEKNGENYSIQSGIGINSNTKQCLEQGDSLMLKLQSGKVITIYAKNQVLPRDIISDDKVVIVNYNSTYSISNENYNLLASSMIVYVRINIGPLVFEQEIKDKLCSKLQNAANCILQ